MGEHYSSFRRPLSSYSGLTRVSNLSRCLLPVSMDPRVKPKGDALGFYQTTSLQIHGVFLQSWNQRMKRE